MPDVINLNDHKPHLTGPARCLHCNHEWQAVAPVGTYKDLECSECGLMKGILIACPEPENTWHCPCGCNIFTVSGISFEIVCWQCGEYQQFPEGK